MRQRKSYRFDNTIGSIADSTYLELLIQHAIYQKGSIFLWQRERSAGSSWFMFVAGNVRFFNRLRIDCRCDALWGSTFSQRYCIPGMIYLVVFCWAAFLVGRHPLPYAFRAQPIGACCSHVPDKYPAYHPLENIFLSTLNSVFIVLIPVCATETRPHFVSTCSTLKGGRRLRTTRWRSAYLRSSEPCRR